MISKDLRKRIAKANKYMAWSRKHKVQGRAWFDYEWPLYTEYPYPIEIVGNHTVKLFTRLSVPWTLSLASTSGSGMTLTRMTRGTGKSLRSK